MKRALTVAAIAAGLVGFAAPAASAAGPDIVQVRYSTEDGVWVGTGVGNQPLVGAYVNDEEACVGFSYQTGTCVPLTWD